jgi:uncharacterized protein with ATP-grasp and redox domains
MKAHLDCVPCIQEQALRAARAAGASQSQQRTILRRVLEHLAQADWTDTPLALGMGVHRIVRELTGVDDPFEQAKARANEAALALYPGLQEQVRNAEDPLHMAVRLALAGNIMDLGAMESYDLTATLDRVASLEFAVDDFDQLAQQLDQAREIILFADNTGEIVFDRLLLETILAQRALDVAVVVKSGPFINDATMRDVEQVGLAEVANLHVLEVSNGDDDEYPAYASDEVARWIADNDVVIAKGQANYEALSEYSGIFYMLMAKCPPVAATIGVEVGDIVVQFR